MPLTREEKLELVKKKQFGTLTREDKIKLLQARDESAKIEADKPFLKKEMPVLGGEIGETYVRPLLQGVGGALGGVAGGVTGAMAGGVGAIPGAIAGGGLGYAAGEEAYKLLGGRESEGLEDIKTAGKNVLEGAAMEAVGAGIPGAVSALREVPGLAKAGIAKALAKKPTTVTMETIPLEVKTGGDVLSQVKQMKYTPEMIEQNKRFKQMGLEELSPAQLQPTIKGEPTPMQTAEGLLRARNPEIYEIGRKQMSSAEEALNKYRTLGASTPESAGQQLKEGLQAGKKKVGEKLGEQLKAVKDVSVFNKKKLPNVSEDFKRLLPNEQTQFKIFADEFKKAKTIDDLSALNSKMATITQTTPEFSGNVFKSTLGKLKNEAKTLIIEAMEQKGIQNPREVYEQYAIVNNLADDTLKGVFKTGQSKNVIGKITASGENIDQFRNAVTRLEQPELMVAVKENWLSNLFNDVQYMNKWDKVKKDGTAQKLLSKKEIEQIDMLTDYINKAKSTASKTVNPPRSGIIAGMEKLADKPAQTIVKVVMGDEAKYWRAVRNYKKMLKETPGEVNGEFRTGDLPEAIRRGAVYEYGRDEQ